MHGASSKQVLHVAIELKSSANLGTLSSIWDPSEAFFPSLHWPGVSHNPAYIYSLLISCAAPLRNSWLRFLGTFPQAAAGSRTPSPLPRGGSPAPSVSPHTLLLQPVSTVACRRAHSGTSAPPYTHKSSAKHCAPMPEAKDHFPWPAVTLNSPRHGCLAWPWGQIADTCCIYCSPGPHICACQATFESTGPQPMLLHMFFPVQMWDLALAIAELCEATASLFLQHTEVHRSSTPASYC